MWKHFVAAMLVYKTILLLGESNLDEDYTVDEDFEDFEENTLDGYDRFNDEDF